MRTEDIKPKIAEEVGIPENLAQLLRGVHRLIEQGDEAVTTSSDDLIQAEFAYGGLLEEDEDLFGFTYFPEKGRKPKWEIVLSAAEIAAVAKGQKDTIQLWRCAAPSCGNRFSTPDETCIDCDYVDDERDPKRLVLESLRGCRSKEAWVSQYLRHFPDSHPFQIIGDYNADKQLPWGSFSLDEMRALVARLNPEG